MKKGKAMMKAISEYDGGEYYASKKEKMKHEKGESKRFEKREKKGLRKMKY